MNPLIAVLAAVLALPAPPAPGDPAYTVFVTYRAEDGVHSAEETTCRGLTLDEATDCALAGAHTSVRLYVPDERGATIIPSSTFEGPLRVIWTPR
jgi:hypothetical protein